MTDCDGRADFTIVSYYLSLGESRCDSSDLSGPARLVAARQAIRPGGCGHDRRGWKNPVGAVSLLQLE
jgi:hypothetical protein